MRAIALAQERGVDAHMLCVFICTLGNQHLFHEGKPEVYLWCNDIIRFDKLHQPDIDSQRRIEQLGNLLLNAEPVADFLLERERTSLNRFLICFALMIYRPFSGSIPQILAITSISLPGEDQAFEAPPSGWGRRMRPMIESRYSSTTT